MLDQPIPKTNKFVITNEERPRRHRYTLWIKKMDRSTCETLKTAVNSVTAVGKVAT